MFNLVSTKLLDVGQLLFPTQADGSMISVDGKIISGSGLDPEISSESALVQVPRISAATGICADKLEDLVN